MDSLDANRLLPKESILNLTENHLYRISLSLTTLSVRKGAFYTILYWFLASIFCFN